MNDEYIRAIENQFTGDIEKDFEFIVKEANHLKNLGLDDSVKQVIKLFESKYPDKAKEFLFSKAKESYEKRKNLYNEAIAFEKNQEFDKAIERIVKLIDSFPIKRNLEDNQVLKSFGTIVETLIYENYFNVDKKKIIHLEEPFANYYFHLALCTYNLDDIDKAIESLNTSLIYNEISADTYLLRAECYYKLGQLDQFFDSITKALDVAYTKHTLGHAYYLLAKYYLSIGDKKATTICAVMSQNFLKTKEANEILVQARQLPGDSVQITQAQDIKEVLDAIHIQMGPSKKVIKSLSIAIAKAKKDNNKLLKYFLQVTYDITHDPNLKKELDEYAKKELENEKGSNN